MKKLVLFFFFSGLIFAGSFAAGRHFDLKGGKRALSSPQARFAPPPFALKNRSFALVVIGLNNGANVAKTLSSIFSQNYEPYRVIYIDDASNDGSFEAARDLIYDSGHAARVVCVQNEKRIGVLANVFRAVQTCEDEEIVVVLSGDDCLAHEWTLQRLNHYYANPDLWFAACQSLEFPEFTPSPEPHLHSFYAALFKKIRESDLMLAGNFLPACAELGFMTPMMKMAKDHFHFIDETLYIRNRAAVQPEDGELKERCAKRICESDPYPELVALRVLECGE